MDLFLSKKVSLSLGIITDRFGNDTEIINKLKVGHKEHLFEPIIQSGVFDKYTNPTREEQLALIYRSNAKLSDIFNLITKTFIPANGVFNNSTVEAMNQAGLRIISGNNNFGTNNDNILPVVSNGTVRANFTKIYNVPETASLASKLGTAWNNRPLESAVGDIVASIGKYGYAVVTLNPSDFENFSNKDLAPKQDVGNLKKLGELIDKIKSRGITITNFTGLTFINSSNYYEPSTPKPSLFDSNLTVHTVYDGFNFPTKMAFLDTNDILVLEKNDGTVQRIINGSLKKEVLDLAVSSKGERGLLGIAIYHRGELPPYVYLYYTKARVDGSDIGAIKNEKNSENVLYRYEFIKNKLQSPKLLLSLPAKSTWAHNGGAIAIGPDKNLYIAIGDQVISDTKVQNIVNGSEPVGNGGILRMDLDGHVVNSGILGNEFPLNLYYAYGIRNSFGISFDPIENNLWDTENGESSGDEINIVKPGFNSGWKKVQGINKGISEDSNSPLVKDSNLVNFHGKGNYREPELIWAFPAGPTGASFLNSTKLGAQYKSNLFVGDFHNGYLYNFRLTDEREHLILPHSDKNNILNKNNSQQFVLGRGFGGIVDVKEAPDGDLYILSTHAGDSNCLTLTKHCVPYESSVGGTIFRISPKVEGAN